MGNDVIRSIRMAAAALLAVSMFAVAGCSDDSAVAPTQNNEEIEPPPIEIKTPKKMRINYVLMEWTALVKSNGDTWDFDPFSAAPRRPDIFFKLGNYTTGVIQNYDAAASTSMQKLSFSAPSYGQMNYDGSYTLQLYDDDGALQGADDLIGQVTVRPEDYYRDDNAERFTIRVYQEKKFSGWAYGVWIY